jgi:HSP20 family molecular chaperone IbpA
MLMKRFKISILGLCSVLGLVSVAIEAKSMAAQQQKMVTTQEIEEQEQMETTTQPKRMRLLPGAQRRTERRMERRQGGQPQCRGGNCRTQRQYSSSKSQIISTGGGVSVNITSPHVVETKDKVVVTMHIGTLTADDIMAEVDGDIIQITGEYNRSGTQISINDSASLPCAVDAKRMTKKVSNGVLTITLPKM